MRTMKPSHGHHGTRITAYGDSAGAGGMRKPVQGGRTPVFDTIRAFSSIEGSGEPLRGGRGREEHPAAALHRHRRASVVPGALGTAAGGRGGTRHRPAGGGAGGTLAGRGAVPQLLRL